MNASTVAQLQTIHDNARAFRAHSSASIYAKCATRSRGPYRHRTMVPIGMATTGQLEIRDSREPESVAGQPT
eukprot:COSAG02_NODE_4386_length_5421_cov_4.810973_4_plen_72_part_00